MMFKKISNIDLINKLEKIENKLDILNMNLNSSQIYCNCKDKDMCIYKELCEYLEFQFKQCIDKIGENKCNLITTNQELTNNFTNILKQITELNKNNIINLTNNNSQVIQTLESFENKINDKFNTINVKLNSIYFENEIIKNQLALQDEIRQSILEIDNITNSINQIVKKIDLINKQ